MTEIEAIADRLIQRIKEDGRLGQVRFIKEYKAQEAETPISGFLAVVSIESMEQSRSFLGNYVTSGLQGEKFHARLSIKIFAPYFENGDGLTELSGILNEEIRKADEEGIIESLTFDPIGFDEQLNAVYRKCSMEIGFFLCEEAVT